MSKYNNHIIENAYGKFQSTNEWARFVFLMGREKAGEIKNLRRQVEYELIPRQTILVPVQLKTKTKMVERVLEQKTSYFADFVYERDGEMVVEDVKGIDDGKRKGKRFSTQTETFIIKKKLMLWRYGIVIKIVGHPTEW